MELAAGIAGVIKVLLQLKYKTLVKSLHCDEINPYIQLKDSPFYIVQEKKEWKRLKDGQGNEVPRRTGVSSFGFGGANAHVIIEEYIDKDSQSEKNGPYLVVLSAKNEDRLREVVKNLHDYLMVNGELGTLNLKNVAYTLQVGREAMDERLAIIAGSIKELKEKLTAFLNSRIEVENLYVGHVQNINDSAELFSEDEDLQQSIEAWIAKGKYAKLLGLWVKGLKIAWHKLYGNNRSKRISLPTYPFASDRYWIPLVKEPKDSIDKANQTHFKLHPLIHENISNLDKQQYTQYLHTGNEVFHFKL